MPKGVWNRPRGALAYPGGYSVNPKTPRAWTRAQVDLLEDLYGRIPNAELARRLGRTVWGMRLKAVKLGIQPWLYSTLSKDDVVIVLGQTGLRSMSGWIEAGWLVVRKVPGRGAGGFRYVIAEDDLVAFLLAHEELVDRRRIDPAYQRHVRQWLTTGEIFRRGGPDPNAIAEAIDETGIEVRHRGVRRVLLEDDLPVLREYRRRRVSDDEHRRRFVRRARLWRRARMDLAVRRSA